MLPSRAVRRTALALVLPCFFGLSFLGASACSYDWNVRAEGDSAADAATKDVVTEAPDAGDTVDSSFDGTVFTDSGPSCADLEAAINAAATNARACSLASGQCTTSVKDQCGCGMYVAVAGSSFANKYAAAVASYLAECIPTCTGCGSPPAGTCLQHGDAGFLCYPP